MSPHPAQRHFYHVSPWRRAVPWLIFGPFLLLAVIVWLVEKKDNDPGVGGFLILVLTPLTFGTHWLISYARLELNAEGVRLRQFAMNLSATWEEITGLRDGRGREGFLTHHAIGGSGAANLAAVRGLSYHANPLYDDEQRAAMAERRWIPIEAFAWHLRRGTLREDMRRLAPSVPVISSPLAHGPTPAASNIGTSATAATSGSRSKERKGLIVFLCLMGEIFGVIIGLGMSPPQLAEQVLAVVFSLLAPFAAARAAFSARHAFRTRAWFMGGLFVCMTLLALLWCLVAWGQAIDAFKPDGQPA